MTWEEHMRKSRDDFNASVKAHWGRSPEEMNATTTAAEIDEGALEAANEAWLSHRGNSLGHLRAAIAAYLAALPAPASGGAVEMREAAARVLDKAADFYEGHGAMDVAREMGALARAIRALPITEPGSGD